MFLPSNLTQAKESIIEFMIDGCRNSIAINEEIKMQGFAGSICFFFMIQKLKMVKTAKKGKKLKIFAFKKIADCSPAPIDLLYNKIIYFTNKIK